MVRSPGDAVADGWRGGMDGTPRFLTRDDVAEILNISTAQVYALVRRGELRAIKIGQRGQWRVERSALEDFIQGRYDDTARFIEAHPLGATDADAEHMVDEAMTAELATDERDH
jgi:excisionase family DNA binding protein